MQNDASGAAPVVDRSSGARRGGWRRLTAGLSRSRPRPSTGPARRWGELPKRTRKARVWHIGVALGICLLSIGDAMYMWVSEGSFLEAIHRAATMGFLLILVELLVIVILEQEEVLHYAKEILAPFESPAARFETLTQDADSPTATVGRDALQTLFATYQLTEGACTVRGEEASLLSYLSFWRFLSALQSTRRRGIRVLAVHSLDVGIWSSSVMQESLDRQAEFVASGGTIERIFLGPSKETPDHRQIRMQMEQKGIDALYSERADFPRDFLVVPKLGYGIVWSGSALGKRIEETEFLSELAASEMAKYLAWFEDARGKRG